MINSNGNAFNELKKIISTNGRSKFYNETHTQICNKGYPTHTPFPPKKLILNTGRGINSEFFSLSSTAFSRANKRKE